MAQRPPFSSIQHFLLQDERHPQNFAWRGSCPPVSAHARWRCPGPPCSAIHGFYPHFRYPPKSVWLPCGKPDAFLFPQAGEKSFPEPPSQRPAGRIAAAVILSQHTAYTCHPEAAGAALIDGRPHHLPGRSDRGKGLALPGGGQCVRSHGSRSTFLSLRQ